MTVGQVKVAGFAAPGFEAVRDAFSGIFAADGELGASLGVYIGGEKTVDLRGGAADPATGRLWGPDTVSVIFSATTGAVAILAWLLAQRGVLDFDAPVTAYWPGFGGGGKSAVPVRYLFTHQAGLPYLDRKITGKRLGEVFAQEIAGPLGLDFCIGLPAGQQGRVARLIEALPPDPRALAAIDPALKAAMMEMAAAAQDPQSPLARAVSASGALPTPDVAVWNDPRVHQSDVF